MIYREKEFAKLCKEILIWILKLNVGEI